MDDGLSISVDRVSSPLNGEKVAEGRMRGGHARGFGSSIETMSRQSTSSPLTLNPSPLIQIVSIALRYPFTSFSLTPALSRPTGEGERAHAR
jgi:hypothetical protein